MKFEINFKFDGTLTGIADETTCGRWCTAAELFLYKILVKDGENIEIFFCQRRGKCWNLQFERNFKVDDRNVKVKKLLWRWYTAVELFL